MQARVRGRGHHGGAGYEDMESTVKTCWAVVVLPRKPDAVRRSERHNKLKRHRKREKGKKNERVDETLRPTAT